MLPPDDPMRQVTGLPLAYGDLHEEDKQELADLKRFVESNGGLRITGYKERCLRRRIAVRMRARGTHRYADYEALLRRDPAEYQRLLDTVTINVSKFFRNPEVWRAVEHHVLPTLFAQEGSEVRIWSAGCAGGEEPYTIAILLQEYAERHHLQSRLGRFRIRATDIDRASLAAAQRGEFGDFAFTEAPDGMRQRWFEGPRQARLRAEIQQRVQFETVDLLRDRLPTGQHLVFCRNVIIYFEREVQEQLFQRFHEALAPGGFLVLGKVETLFGPAAMAFSAVANRERIFRKV
ncbi:MAG TPA: protein-glutamate O-methyltransferase CheR [Longimicrobiales bacterium]